MSNTLFRLILLLLPNQLGSHFWPGFSRVMGLKIDYLSPTIYLTHILIVLLLLLNLKKILREAKKNGHFTKTLLVFGLVNTLLSLSPILTITKWAEYLLYYFFYLYLKGYRSLFRKNLKCFYLALLVVFFIQLSQFLNQKSLGGILYWLGERDFTQNTSSLPKIQILSREFIRVPSTFSHANSLGGFMLLSLIFLKFIKGKTIPKVISLASVLLSGSKNAILFLSLYLLKKISIKKVLLVCVLISILLAILSPFGSDFDYTVSSRLARISSSLEIIRDHTMYGTGLGAYIVGLGEQLYGSQITYENLQPVHNIYFLILSEVGLVGLFFLYFLLRQIKIGNYQSILLTVVLFTGIFDHYWLTLIQNKVLLTILLASFPVKYNS